MATATQNIASATRPVRTNWLTSTFRSALAYLAHRRRVAQTVRELEAMTDRQLQDIGVIRGDIQLIAEKSA